MSQESWLRSYLSYTGKHEAPELFHFWVGVSVISAALGRKCYFRKGYYKLYPNFFTVLVAGSARCRKTTAIEIGVALLKDTSVRITTGKSSTERFIIDQVWQKEGPPPASLVKADELSVFLTKDQMGEKLIDVLTKLFDCPDEFPYKTFARGEQIIKEPYLTILAGTQPTSLAKVLPDSAFGGGFTSRIIFVYQEDTPRRNALPELSEEELLLGLSLAKRIVEISERSGEFVLSPEARNHYKDWYDTIPPSGDDNKIDGFIGRKGDHVLRLSMILRASQGDGFDIQLKHILAAIAAIDEIERLLPQAFGDVGKNVDTKGRVDKLYRTIHRGAGIGVPHSTALKKMYGELDAQSFRIAMDTLIQSGMVARSDEPPRNYICLCEPCKLVRTKKLTYS